jgi:hypothetical protein
MYDAFAMATRPKLLSALLCLLHLLSHTHLKGNAANISYFEFKILKAAFSILTAPICMCVGVHVCVRVCGWVCARARALRISIHTAWRHLRDRWAHQVT